MSGLRGLATGVGSLPCKDSDRALELIFKYVPNIPFWPQLPKRDKKEGMIAQFSQNFPCLRFIDAELVFDPKNQEKELETFYDRLLVNDLEYFKITYDYAEGLSKFYLRLEKSDLSKIEFIKCQITGPFTFAAAVNDEAKKSLLYNQTFMQAISKGLVMKALWQINLFKKFGKKIIMFIDEPYLGTFGSAYTAVNKGDVVNVLSEVTQAVKSSGVLTGVHCCGNTDWSIFAEVPGIDIINFDAYDFMEKFELYADSLDGFIRRNGIICWGIVPTENFCNQEPEFLLGRIDRGMDNLAKKGVSRQLLQENFLISPSCGLGALSENKAEPIFDTLSRTSAIIRQK